MATRILDWTLANMWDPQTGLFAYQQRRGMRTWIRELRWCQGWMSLAHADYLEMAAVDGRLPAGAAGGGSGMSG